MHSKRTGRGEATSFACRVSPALCHQRRPCWQCVETALTTGAVPATSARQSCSSTRPTRLGGHQHECAAARIRRLGRHLAALLTASFFFLSALMHGIVAGFNWKQAWASDSQERRVITTWQGWYYRWMHECRQPLRWAEYSISVGHADRHCHLVGRGARLHAHPHLLLELWHRDDLRPLCRELHGRPQLRYRDSAANLGAVQCLPARLPQLAWVGAGLARSGPCFCTCSTATRATVARPPLSTSSSTASLSPS